ncbi:hypothetical protein D3C71_648640 [compost metagenome]
MIFSFSLLSLGTIPGQPTQQISVESKAEFRPVAKPPALGLMISLSFFRSICIGSLFEIIIFFLFFIKILDRFICSLEEL